jgi:hypothetical protein
MFGPPIISGLSKPPAIIVDRPGHRSDPFGPVPPSGSAGDQASPNGLSIVQGNSIFAPDERRGSVDSVGMRCALLLLIRGLGPRFDPPSVCRYGMKLKIAG